MATAPAKTSTVDEIVSIVGLVNSLVPLAQEVIATVQKYGTNLTPTSVATIGGTAAQAIFTGLASFSKGGQANTVNALSGVIPGLIAEILGISTEIEQAVEGTGTQTPAAVQTPSGQPADIDAPEVA